MATDNPLNTLIDLTKNQADEAARQLQAITASRDGAQEQLATLHVYRQDYIERFEKASVEGMSAANYHNFRQFIATLDEAISQQNKIVSQLDLKLEQGKQQWFDQKRQLTSYETLLSRQENERQLQLNRKEQKFNDEMSMHQYRRHQPHAKGNG
ncbi:flagellar export protein FliJ [Neopusillimonas aromaticivorans]|uniref:flagellar export protein FliJ n=1 Tax=Neopusillimonas aromaticivorans TaxID=2979868 RepID=UPI00259839EE|nr:flagellar export protein FliJ [Neopusillimonas aromaticivorans]WJJ93198.1 flagellar export protein FliJ [Neopusillimonas aromaticivorans]